MGVTPATAAAIGLLGGSFDPIHYGHLQLARDALTHLQLREVRFIPAAQPWQKGELAAAEHRLRMIQLAIADQPRFVLDLVEIDRGGATYTLDTLHALRLKQPGEPLVLIMGSDQFARLDTWRGWEQIVEMAHIAVASRARSSLAPSVAVQAMLSARHGTPASLASPAGGSIVEFTMTPVDVSATEIRRLLRERRSAEREQRLSAMVPAAVLDYIYLHHLYQD